MPTPRILVALILALAPATLAAQAPANVGIGPAMDVEDGAKGFGAHSDQERLLESELFRFVRIHWDVVMDLARTR